MATSGWGLTDRTRSRRDGQEAGVRIGDPLHSSRSESVRNSGNWSVRSASRPQRNRDRRLTELFWYLGEPRGPLRFPHDPSASLSIRSRKVTPERSWGVSTNRYSRPIGRLSQCAAKALVPLGDDHIPRRAIGHYRRRCLLPGRRRNANVLSRQRPVDDLFGHAHQLTLRAVSHFWVERTELLPGLAGMPSFNWRRPQRRRHLDGDRAIEIINFIDDYSRAVLASVPCPWLPHQMWCASSSKQRPFTGFRPRCSVTKAPSTPPPTGGVIPPWRSSWPPLGITFKHGKPYHPQTRARWSAIT